MGVYFNFEPVTHVTNLNKKQARIPRCLVDQVARNAEKTVNAVTTASALQTVDAELDATAQQAKTHALVKLVEHARVAMIANALHATASDSEVFKFINSRHS